MYKRKIEGCLVKLEKRHHIDSAIKLGNYNIGRTNNILTLPIYMAFLLNQL